METKKRRTEIHKILIERKITSEKDGKIFYEELQNPQNMLDDVLNYYYEHYLYTSENDKDRKEILKSSNICYYLSNVTQSDSISNVTINYIKFNKNSKVVNVDSLESNYVKHKNEGDEDYQHYCIKIYKNTNRAVLIFEKIVGAVTITMLTRHINKAYKEYVNVTYKDDVNNLKKFLEYEIKIWPVPSPDFLAELERLDKISLLQISVDKEKFTADEDIVYAEENVSRDYVDLSYKPIQGLSFSKHKIKKYYEKFKSSTGSTKIRRLIISGRKDGNSVSLDTEQMKLKKYITAKLDINGFVESKYLFSEYNKLINNNFKEYFNNIFIDIEESED